MVLKLPHEGAIFQEECGAGVMTELLEMAVAEIRKLPPEKQDQAARAIFDVVHGAEEEVYVLSDEENAAIDEGLAELERGEFVTLEEMRARLAKHLR